MVITLLNPHTHTPLHLRGGVSHPLAPYPLQPRTWKQLHTGTHTTMLPYVYAGHRNPTCVR